MNTKRASRKGNESGQVLPFVAMLLIVLLAILALVLDGGNLYLNRRSMQNAADAGALAGARVFCLDGTEAEAEAAAQQYTVQRNGAESAAVDADPASRTVEVVARNDVAMTFARVIGIHEVPVAAEAAARCVPAAKAYGVAPIAILDFPYAYYETYTIWDSDVDAVEDAYGNPISGSGRGWLSLDCVWEDTCIEGAVLLDGYMQDGYPGDVWVEALVHHAPGVMQKLIKTNLIGKRLIIPVYDRIEEIGNSPYYHIIRFAVFLVSDIARRGNEKGIVGSFQGFVVPSPPSPGPDGGLRTLELIR
jgi:hypothetical protein